MNTWFYDGIMPEYMLNNHEQLCGAGTNFTEWAQFQAGFWSKFLPLYFGLVFSVYLLSSWFPDFGISEPDLPLEKLMVAHRTEKLGLKPDWLGTSRRPIIRFDQFGLRVHY